MNDQKKIAIVSNTMCVGGVEVALLELLKVFDYDHYHVTLYLRDASGPFFCRIDKRVEVRFWSHQDSREAFIGQFRQAHLFHLLRGISSRIRSRLTLSDWARNAFFGAKSLPVLDESPYDCVIAYHGATPEVLATTLYRLKSPRKIAWIHGDDHFPSGHEVFWDHIYRKFDRIACVSEAIRRSATKNYPSLNNMTYTCYNVIDAQRIETLAEEQITDVMHSPSLLTVGRITHVKGQQMVPETARLLLDKGYPVHWYLIGDGDKAKELTQLIDWFRVREHVTLLGEKKNPYPYMKACDIYVQTSLSEGWCLTVQEARILCKPIVTTNLPVMHEHIINGQSGLIAEDISPKSLADAIASLLDSPSLKSQFEKVLLAQKHTQTTKSLDQIYSLLES